MITNKTIFILGAGAHCPYEFPDGSGLMKQMIAELPTKDNPRATKFTECVLGTLQQPQPYTVSALVSLRKALEFSGHQSIDSFLYTHRKNDLFVQVGRWLIAWILLPLEFRYKFSRITPDRDRVAKPKQDYDWMSYLFARMLKQSHESPKEFVANNKVGFVTFNYDRTLEYFLTWKLYNTFPGLSMGAAWEFAQQIPVIHVYGSLGPFDPKLVDVRNDRYPNTIKAAAAGIRLMYEERNDETALEEFKKIINSAKKVIFLGFGFDPDNIQVLQLPELLRLVPAQGVMSSRFKVPEGEWEAMMHDMLPILINEDNKLTRVISRDWDALTFLRESRALE